MFAMVRGNAIVTDRSRVMGNAHVGGDAIIRGNVVISENACIEGLAVIEKPNDYLVIGPIGPESDHVTVTFSDNMVRARGLPGHLRKWRNPQRRITRISCRLSDLSH